jgi:bifunctional non-homologous end joining protein LigD
MADDPLSSYRAKRDFRSTAEPEGAAPKRRKGKALAFVVQKHDATRLHYDFRLELNGVLKSWAVTRGPSLDPADKRLAVEVEDHPVEYGSFEGTIASGYGAGTVMLWDRGSWEPESDDPAADLEKGRLRFTLHGERLHGSWHLVRMRPRGRETKHNWLLIKDEDEEARPGEGDALLEEFDRSVTTGRNLEGIAGKAAAKAVPPAKRSARKPAPRKTPAAKKAAEPGFIPPMLCVLESEAPSGAGWVHEIKLDGYRMLAVIQGGKARLLTRTAQDWSHRFPEVAQALGALPDAVLDGELVAPDKDGNPDFAALQAAMEKGTTASLRFFAFDLPVQGGKDLRAQPLLKRKAALQSMLKDAPPEVVFVEHFTERGDTLLRSSCRIGLEGIVSKRADSPYREGRNGDWVKTKCRGNDEFVIGGHGEGAKGRMTLLLGAWREGKLVYLGRVGSGISGEKAKDLAKRLSELKRKDSPFANAPTDRRTTSWVEPRLVAEVDYAGWTADGLLRQASFKGVREDKPAEEVGIPKPGEPQPKAAPARAASDRSVVAGVALSHPEKLYWPEEGITKRDLAEYMEAVAPRLLPWIAGRPLSLLRAPDGISGDRFFQRHAGRGTSALITQVKPRGEKSPLLQVDRMEALVALAQSGTLEIHPWPARSATIMQPDRLILDLDPAEDLPFARVVEAALALRERVSALGMVPFCKTTGGKGLHIVVPVAPGATWKALHSTAEQICKALEDEAPGSFTTDNAKAKRGGRIFLDYQRNARGASAVAAWSPRARPGATVSMPLDWSEVTKTLDPKAFTLRSAPARLKEADPWAGFEAAAKPLPGKAKR